MNRIYKLFSLVIVCVLFLTLTSCVKKGDYNEEDIKLPTTKEETIELISKISGVVYEIQDEDIEEYAPKGTVFALVAGTFSEGICGIYFDSVESRDAGFEESKTLIEHSMDIEYDANADEIEVKKNGNWVYGGTKKFVEYFEGKATADSLTPKLPSTVKETEEFFKANGYMTGSFELPKDTDEPNEKGIIGYVQAGKDGDTKSVFLCFLVDTEENANKYREDLIDTLEDALSEEIIDDLGWEINSYSFGVVGNFVYLGTKDAVNLFVGKENIEYKIPTTEEEIVELLEKIPHVTYTFVDENHSIFNNYPTGTKIVFLADTNVEGIIGIYFDTIENRDKEYTKAKEQIEEEFFRYVSGSNDIEVKKIDNWVIGGTANMLGYFEGTKKVYTIGAKKPSTLMDLCKIFGRKGYNGWFVEYEERDAEMKVYGMLGYFSFELKESNNLFKCYLIESQEKAMKYSDELYIKLQERLKKENLELYESEDFIYTCGIYENYVYIGTKGAVDLLLN